MKTELIIDDPDNYSEGGSAEFYSLKGLPKLGFKQFRDKKYALSAYSKQKKLAKFNLAPKVYGGVKRIQYSLSDKTGWGFITEVAIIIDANFVNKNKLKQIQNLVNEIYEKTGLKFWDCHYNNIGYVKRNRKNKLVCIDTGKESFSAIANAWGNPDPGPKCSYCNKYICDCEK